MSHDLPDGILQWIVEAMPEAVVYSDREGVIRLWNRGAETIFGYRQEDALGRTLDLIIPERWRAQHWEGYRTVMRTGITRYGRELLAVPADRGTGLGSPSSSPSWSPGIATVRRSEPWPSFATSPHDGNRSRHCGRSWRRWKPRTRKAGKRDVLVTADRAPRRCERQCRGVNVRFDLA
jgi:PAS domain-containing protein